MNVKHTSLMFGAGAFMLLTSNGLVLAGPAAPKTYTAQSGMLTINLPQDSFVVVDGYTYHYNRTCAEGFFSCRKIDKTWLGTETSLNGTCTGNPTSTSPSTTGTDGALNNLINDSKCGFFDGVDLADPTSQNNTGICVSFSNSSPPSTKESSHRTDIECEYVSQAPVDPRVGFVTPGDVPTCWTLDSTTGELPTITPSGTAASESAQCTSTHPLKYSFTLLDPTSGNGTRVTNLTATLTGGSVNDTWSEALTNLSVAPSLVGQDFEYTENAGGQNGTVSLLTPENTPAYVNAIQATPGGVPARGPVPTGCATSDQFAGNNGVGGDLAAWTALTASSPLAPIAGTYTLNVAATLKSSVAGQANLPISVCGQISVDAGSCQQSSTPCP
jgi:hypothetical protein